MKKTTQGLCCFAKVISRHFRSIGIELGLKSFRKSEFGGTYVISWQCEAKGVTLRNFE